MSGKSTTLILLHCWYYLLDIWFRTFGFVNDFHNKLKRMDCMLKFAK